MFLISLLLFSATTVFSQEDFTGHKLLRLVPGNQEQEEFLRNMTEQRNMDVWATPTSLNKNMVVRVPPEDAKDLESSLSSEGIDFTVITNNIQQWIDEERMQNPINKILPLSAYQNNFRFDTYHRFEEISAYIDSVGNAYSSLAQIQQIGTTFERNPLKGLKIGSAGESKPSILIDAGYHAREWVAPATALYIINQLVTGYENNSEIRQMLDSFDWYIFPVMNPDGYKHTWTLNRLWRKNRSRASALFPICRGADANRNFDIDFGGSSTSSNPCADTYPGPSAFSEAESSATRDFILGQGGRLKSYVTVHSYSQLWLTPYGYTTDLPPDSNDHMKALDAACTAVRNTHGQNYTCGPIANTIYPASGSSTDWAYINGNVKYSIAIELRDTGRYGFLLPRNQIIPTAEENFAGIKALYDILQSEL